MAERRLTTATVLFCDLVGSTAQRTRLGDDAADRLASVLDTLLRDAVAEHHGTVVKGTGDGLMAVFDATSDALNAGVAVQQASAQHNRRADEIEQLVLRTGLSAGDVQFVANDCHGRAVVEAARLEAAAAPGQILASGLVRALAGSRGQHDFDPLGVLDLKGLEPVDAFQVRWEPLTPSATLPMPWRMDVEPRSGVVGRATELQILREAAEQARRGERSVVLLGGEAGVGKTTLVAELARAVHADATTVLYGACDEDITIPYRMFVETLRHLVVHAPDDWLERLDATQLAQLARLVPELSVRCTDLRPVAAADADAERYLLYNAVAGLLAAASQIEPLVLVLDDLHWADRPSLLLLRHLIAAPLGNILILGTYRDVELTPTHPFTEALGALAREPRVERLAVGRFEADDVVTMMEAAAGHDLDDSGREFAREIWRETDGNPFFVAEVLRHLTETGAFVQDETGQWRTTIQLTELGIPDTVRHVVRARAARLGDEEIGVLGTASVLGRRFDLELLAQVTGRQSEQLLDVLERAEQLALVVEAPDAPRTFKFRHALVHQSLYRDLSLSRRQHLHLRAAEQILAGDAPPAMRVLDVAQHLHAAGDLPDAVLRRTAYRRAGEHAHAMLAPDEAIRWFTRGLELEVDTEDERREHCELLLGLGVAERDAGVPTYRDTLRRAGALASAIGSADLMAHAALANFRGFWSTSGSVDEERITELDSAREALGAADDPITARILATTSVELLYAEDDDRRLAMADDALGMGRRLEEPATLAYVLRAWDLVHRLPWFLLQRGDVVHEHLRLAEELSDPVERFWAVNNASIVALEQADPARFGELVPQVLPLAGATGQRLLEWIGGFVAVNHHIIRCDWDDAEALMERTHRFGVECGQPDADAVYASHLFEIRRAQGREEELVDLLRAVVESAPDIEAFRPALGVCYAALGLPDGGDLFEEDLAGGFGRYRHNGLWLTSMMMNAEIASFLGHRAGAEVLYDRLSPWRDQVAWTGTTAGGAVAGSVGELATLLGRFEEADAHLTRALAVHRAFAAPAWVAKTLVSLARLATSRRAPGDDDIADAAVAEATVLARELGSTTIARKLDSVAVLR
jgi:class 3 adenylate cyclase/tetratricopeptide (TPR) repeat protein